MKYGLLLLAGTILFTVLDGIGLPLLTKYFFQEQIGHLLREHIDRLAAILVWLLLAAGVLIFVVTNASVNDAGDAFSMGMIFGLIVFGVYELTNQAMLKARDRNLVLVDISWGMFVCATVSTVLRYLASYLQIIGQ